jgi:pyruvate formate lyase activating enzyme
LSKTGIIFDISKYAVHDGPGIRTTVFFKGCPLNCIWCHNPESKKPKPESAVNINQNRPLKSLFCGNKDFIGKEVTVDEVMIEIEKDRMFYEQSGGGVTFSGGEPLMQPEFLEELLIECKDRDIKTAVDTSGYASTEIITRISAYTGLFLFDLKIMDEQAHIEHTGVSNKIIHENLINLSRAGKSIRIRIPLIPGITDTEININQIIDFLLQLNNIIYIDLLPYNNLSEEKNKKFNSINRLEGLQVQPDETINKIAETFARNGYTITIRG